MSELKRLNKMALDHGTYRNCNSDYSFLLPIVLSNDCREQITLQIKELICFCENQTKKAIDDYSEFS